LLLAAPRLAWGHTARDTVSCYRLFYGAGEDHPDQLFAEYVAVHSAHDSVVRSGMGPDKPERFWRMFLVGATWEQHRDTLILHFTNGFSGVLYKLTPVQQDSLSGQVWFLYDVVDRRPPPVAVAAKRVACQSAHLQSPDYTQAQADRTRLERRIQELQQTEEARVAALTSPLAGTYEFKIVIADSQVVTVYGRTEIHPANPVWSLSDHWNNAPDDTLKPYRAEGNQLRMVVAYKPDALPSVGRDNDESGTCVAYFTISEHPFLATRDSTAWRGDADVLFAASRCAGDGVLHDALLQASGAVSDVWFKDVPGRTDGRFVLDKRGEARVSMEVTRRGVTVLTLRGRRIARTVTSTPE
jgi:hypothetical protein